MSRIILRLVHCNDPVSNAIIFQTGGLYSHVEAVTSDGLYIGAHADGGVQARPSDYDLGKFDRQRFLELAASDEMSLRFYHYLRATIGEPYDFGAIAGFVAHYDVHQRARVICSALITLALRGCGFFQRPLSQLAHKVSPRDLELILSGRGDVREIPFSSLQLAGVPSC
jgi:hypothetical protein